MELAHQHFLVRAFVKDAPIKEEVLNEWLTRLVEAIGMQVCIPARSFYVSDEGNEGLTGQIGLKTSHCAIHLWTAHSPSLVQMDVYSCKPFNTDVVVNFLLEWGLTKYQSLLLDREDGFKIVQ